MQKLLTLAHHDSLVFGYLTAFVFDLMTLMQMMDLNERCLEHLDQLQTIQFHAIL